MELDNRGGRSAIEVVDVPFLEIFKARLDVVLSKLKMLLLIVRGLD